MSENILEINNLTKHFNSTSGGIFNRKKGVVKAVDGVSINVKRGETVGLVGESGCGKTTVGRTVMKLYEPTSGQIIFDGQDITNLKRREMKSIRSKMQMIFQDPFASLNPRHTVGTIIEASFIIHGVTPEGGTKKAVRNLLERVGLNPEHLNRFPHEFSGGQRQRIGIARALYTNPKIIILDEATSALDAGTEQAITSAIRDLKGFVTLLVVAHRLSTIQDADNVVYIAEGEIIATGSFEDVRKSVPDFEKQAMIMGL